MIKQIFIVFRKEVLDNFRDKRSVFFALLYGPVLLPMLMIGPMAMGVKKYSVDIDQPVVVHMSESEMAPNLVQFLLEQNIQVNNAGADFQSKVLSQELDLVIELSPDYVDSISQARFTSIRLYYNKRSDQSEKAFRQVSRALELFNRSLASSRLALRGLDYSFVKPIQIIGEDLGELDQGMKAISLMVPFILVLSLTMGGFYLAVDNTAGERERHSLEPLLSLSVSRFYLALGKLSCLMSFVTISALLATTNTYLLFKFIPVEALRLLLDVQLRTFVIIFLICLPLVPFFTSAMMLIAAFARDTKEAQTHLGLSMMLPMAPFFIMQFADVEQNSNLFMVPVLSQFMLIERVIAGDEILSMQLVHSVVSVGLCALLFFYLIVNLYKKESILK